MLLSFYLAPQRVRGAGRKPWQVDVLEIDSETPPAWMTQEDQRADWNAAYVLRLQLLAALAERGAKP
jgi:hypothetical protein